MSLYSSTNSKRSNPILLSALCAAGLSFGVVVPKAQADEWNKKTILTVDETIQVQDNVLKPGKYVFKLLDSQSDRHVVQIFNADESHLIDTILAIPNYRMNPGGRQFVFYETPAGAAKAMHAWFYPGDNFGQEFRYPKHLTMLTAAVMPSMPPAQPEAQPMSQPEPQPAAQPETSVQPSEPAPVQAQAQEQTEVAQNTAPSSPAPSSDTTPTTLPKTGSVYPLIGLSGLISLGLFSMLRFWRRA